MSLFPEVLWAQRSHPSDAEKVRTYASGFRKPSLVELDTNDDANVAWVRQNIVYLTINLPDIIESLMTIDLTATGLGFHARTGEYVYQSSMYILVLLTPVPLRHSASKGIPEHDYAFKLEFSEEILPEVGPLLSTQGPWSHCRVPVLKPWS